MKKRPEELFLGESYEFDVTAKIGENRFASKLDLSPQKISFRIMGEESEDRAYTGEWSDLDSLTCRAPNTIFILKNLKIKKARHSTIERHPRHIGFFEIDYTAEYLIMVPSDLGSNIKFDKISIHSETINKWIGSTQNQEIILKSHYENSWPNENLNEFQEPINDHITLGASYTISSYYSSPNHEAGIKFPPYFFLRLDSGVSSKQIIHTYAKLYTFLSVITGGNISVQKIKLNFSHQSSKAASLYYTENTHKPAPPEAILFPLGKDIWTGHITPPFPTKSFPKYFELQEIEQDYFSRYLTYREMGNSEDKFLGFFRLLESLCFKSKNFVSDEVLEELKKLTAAHLKATNISKSDIYSFTRGLDRYNKSKYNTEKCILDFLKKIPNHAKSRWKFKDDSINEICKLRNNITHANEFHIKDGELDSYTKFIETLLVLALLDLTEINLETSSLIIHRLTGHSWITKPTGVIKVTTSEQ